MAIEKKYINLSDNSDSNVNTKLYIDQYNTTELIKSVDTTVTELIKALPDVNLDLIPKPIYDAELSHSADLQREVDTLTQDVFSLNSRIQTLLADSSSLYIDNDNLNVKVAGLENSLAQSATTTYELRTNLTTSLIKAINEATERTSLEAENNGLTAQKNALIKQIDTLNNLLAQANATIQVAQQQLSAKAQAVAGGGISTGELATIVFDVGDITKSTQMAMIIQDFNGGPFGKPNKFSKSDGGNEKQFTSYFDIVTGPKDITVDIKVTGSFTLNPYDFGFSIPVSLKANETKRFPMDNPNAAWVKGVNGNDGGSFWKSSKPNSTDFTFSIIVKDVDPTGKTENKNFTGHIWKY